MSAPYHRRHPRPSGHRTTGDQDAGFCRPTTTGRSRAPVHPAQDRPCDPKKFQASGRSPPRSAVCRCSHRPGPCPSPAQTVPRHGGPADIFDRPRASSRRVRETHWRPGWAGHAPRPSRDRGTSSQSRPNPRAMCHPTSAGACPRPSVRSQCRHRCPATKAAGQTPTPAARRRARGVR